MYIKVCFLKVERYEKEITFIHIKREKSCLPTMSLFSYSLKESGQKSLSLKTDGKIDSLNAE